jgi:hypothetical protein
LSEAQQRRLQNKGITQSQYRNKSFKLSAAYGHGRTPQHPRDAISHPERFPGYKPRGEIALSASDHDKLVAEVIERIERGDLDLPVQARLTRHDYDPELVREGISQMSNAQLVSLRTLDLTDIADIAGVQEPSARYQKWFYRGADGKWYNKLWYHAD